MTEFQSHPRAMAAGLGLPLLSTGATFGAASADFSGPNQPIFTTQPDFIARPPDLNRITTTQLLILAGPAPPPLSLLSPTSEFCCALVAMLF